jgi:hypothetical protein
MTLSLLENLQLVRSVIFKPKEFWQKQKQQKQTKGSLFFSYFIPILAVVAIAVFLGEFLKNNNYYAGFALLKSLREVLLFTLHYFISVFFTYHLMKTFGSEKNLTAARMLVVFSLTPFLLVSIVTGLFQYLYVVDALGLYSFYIFWVGAKELLDFPDGKFEKFALITVLVNFFIFSFLSISLSKLLTAYL